MRYEVVRCYRCFKSEISRNGLPSEWQEVRMQTPFISKALELCKECAEIVAKRFMDL